MKPGVNVTIGGEIYIAAPLTFGALRRMQDICPPASPNDRVYANEVLAFVLLESLKRNYDGVDAFWLNETLEASEVEQAAVAELDIMRLSGLIKAKAGDPGEAPAVTG